MAINDNQQKSTQRYIEIESRQIPVTEEVYHAYKNPVRAEQKRKQREWRCRDGRGVRCAKDCTQCEIYRIGKGPSGNILSLDVLEEETEYVHPSKTNVEETVMYGILLEQLLKALDELDPDSRRICELIRQGASERDIAAEFGIRQSTLNYRKQKLMAQLRERLKKFR
jgi:RNA polymerase sigma factor (sigma-70 family)